MNDYVDDDVNDNGDEPPVELHVWSRMHMIFVFIICFNFCEPMLSVKVPFYLYLMKVAIDEILQVLLWLSMISPSSQVNEQTTAYPNNTNKITENINDNTICNKLDIVTEEILWEVFYINVTFCYMVVAMIISTVSVILGVIEEIMGMIDGIQPLDDFEWVLFFRIVFINT